MFQYDDEKSKESIGSILRQQRESQKLNLEEIAEELKIRSQYLEALENDQFELLPGTLYQRSFLKTYAQFLDLDPVHILKMFDQYEKTQISLRKETEETLPEGRKPLEESIKDQSTLHKQPQSSKSRAGYWFGILAGVVLGIFCLIYLARPGMKKKHDIASELSVAAIESLNVELEVVDTTSFAWRLDNLLSNSAEMTLRVEAKGDSWVRIIADKKTSFSGIIAAKMAIEFKANDYFSINLGKNEGVETYLNGMKMNPLEKGIHRLDRKNYKSFFSPGSIGQDL
ncbi:MAG: helix-turn-helix domain-containing protein [candidate division Zixibacteria bacterium]|nr:helix-turn-helix domain-containing protein [candidate division Zixibacteria bacterium]